MARNKKLQAIVEIAGALNPSLRKSIGRATSCLDKINVKALAVGAAVAGVTVAAVKFAADSTESAKAYQKQMSNVATLLDGDVKGRIGELSDEILKVSNKTGLVTEGLTDGLYQVVSAFGDTADSSKSLAIAAKAAKAGNATTTASVNLLSSVTKGYGDISLEAQQKAADLAFQTVKLGQTTFPELASSMGKVIPLAKTMGITQEELFGATATLTGVTGNTSEVMTQLRGTVQGLLQPTKEMSAAITSLGYADGKTLIESEGLQGALELLKGSVNNNELAFSGLFGSVEAKNAVLALAGAQAENFTKKTQSMYEATGAADRAFAAQTDNLSDMSAKIKNLGANFKTSVGMKILPIISNITEKALPVLEEVLPAVAEALGGLFEGAAPVLMILKKATPVVGSVTKGLSRFVKWISSTEGAFETLAIVLGTVTALIIAYKTQQALASAGTTLWATVSGGATAATTALGAAFTFLTSPIGLIIIGIGALIAAGVLLYKNWDFVKEKATAFGSAVLAVFDSIGRGIAAAFTMPIDFIIGGINMFLKGLNKIKIPKWVPGIGGKGIEIPLIPKLSSGEVASVTVERIPTFATGGFTDGISIAGEAGREAVISFDPAYRKENIGYWAQAGELLGMDNFSLGSLSGSTVIIYDFSGFHYNPTIEADSDTDTNNLIEKLKQHEHEFFDWLERWLSRRDVGDFARHTIY